MHRDAAPDHSTFIFLLTKVGNVFLGQAQMHLVTRLDLAQIHI
jgi:hypothetical protein